MRYRFKGLVRTTGQPVEGHAHGQTPDEALMSLSEHGIVTESLREEPETVTPDTSTPLGSALESALDTASQQVPFDALANKFKGKNVWVLDRDKIRRRVAQVVDNALRDALSQHGEEGGATNVREQVAEAISGLFKDGRNLTSQVSNTSMQLENQIKRIEVITRRAEAVLAQMTIAIGRMGSGGFGGGGVGMGPRRYASGTGQRNEQNTVLLEIFKENLRLRGIEIDEDASAAAAAAKEGAAATEEQAANGNGNHGEPPGEGTIQHPTPQPVAPTKVDVTLTVPEELKNLPPAKSSASPLKQWTTDL